MVAVRLPQLKSSKWNTIELISNGDLLQPHLIYQAILSIITLQVTESLSIAMTFWYAFTTKTVMKLKTPPSIYPKLTKNQSKLNQEWNNKTEKGNSWVLFHWKSRNHSKPPYLGQYLSKHTSDYVSYRL